MRLIATIHTNTSFGLLDHAIQRGSVPCSSMYSPAAPNARTRPHRTSRLSDTFSPVSAVDFERESQERRYPISPYRLLGAIGIVLTGIAAAILHLSKLVP
jgi:hypothetical protein